MATIQWHEWNAATFKKAQQEHKPIFLDISASWCHWCHVLDQTTLADPDVVAALNRDFISVRVDTDKRPDVNERYNQGGWPTTAFLTGDGHIIAGMTYVPPEHFKALLPQVKEFYATQGDAIVNTVHPLTYQEGLVGGEIVDTVVTYLKENFDSNYGGWFEQPKFPLPEAIELLLFCGATQPDAKLLDMARGTLEAMSGIYDSEEDGFFRYAVQRDWTEPHYEKMLEVNMGLLRNYLHAFALTGEVRYRVFAEGILKYVRAVLKAPQGGFFGSQDADEDYYQQTLAERTGTPPLVDRTIYVGWNGRAILALLDAAAILSDSIAFSEAREIMDFFMMNCWDGSRGMCHYYDGTPQIWGLLADNAWALCAASRMFQATGERRYLDFAEGIAQWLMKHLGDEKGFFDRVPEEELGLLKARNKPPAENSVVAMGLIDLAELTGKEIYRTAATASLQIFAHDFQMFGVHAAGYALAVAKALDPWHVAVVGGAKERDAIRMLLAIPDHRIIIEYLDPARDGARLAVLGYGPGVYSCAGGMCRRFDSVKDAAEKLRG